MEMEKVCSNCEYCKDNICRDEACVGCFDDVEHGNFKPKKRWNTFHIYENGIMDNILANDVRNQLQSNLGFADYSETGKFDVGVNIEKGDWEQLNNMKFYYRDEKVIIGNDTFNLVSLRSYNTIVGFRWMGKVYIIGKYSTSTTNQINSFIKGIGNPETIYYTRREA